MRSLISLGVRCTTLTSTIVINVVVPVETGIACVGVGLAIVTGVWVLVGGIALVAVGGTGVRVGSAVFVGGNAEGVSVGVSGTGVLLGFAVSVTFAVFVACSATVATLSVVASAVFVATGLAPPLPKAMNTAKPASATTPTKPAPNIGSGSLPGLLTRAVSPNVVVSSEAIVALRGSGWGVSGPAIALGVLNAVFISSALWKRFSGSNSNAVSIVCASTSLTFAGRLARGMYFSGF